MAESNAQLVEALEMLEERLETPIVPGELASWIDDAGAGVDAVAAQLKPHVEKTHPKQLQEIVRQDTGLATRVDQLRQADAELLKQLRDVRRLMDVLRANADRLEPDEAPAEDVNAALVEKGLQLVIAARKQEAAISTWYVEAFDRDRGVVD